MGSISNLSQAGTGNRNEVSWTNVPAFPRGTGIMGSGSNIKEQCSTVVMNIRVLTARGFWVSNPGNGIQMLYP